MWAILNRTPYKAESTWGRDREGIHEWIVAVKGTFNIKTDGEAVLADEQLEPLLSPEYNGEEGRSSLRYDADLVAPKPTTDILINGTAYSPEGRPSRAFLVEMRVGPMRKTLRVRGNRRWEGGPFGSSPSAVQPITEVPVVYERAYGGYDHSDPDPKYHLMDPRNPVGCGLPSRSSRRSGDLLPNLEYPDGQVEKTGPAGFGAINSFWSPRAELAGTYDADWRQHRLPLAPVDWDPRSLLCSPVDQRPETFLRGGEAVELLNLNPSGRLRFTLPRVHLAFNTRIDKRSEEHRARLSTVIIEPDHPRVIMVWLTAIKCHTAVDYLDRTVVREKAFLT